MIPQAIIYRLSGGRDAINRIRPLMHRNIGLTQLFLYQHIMQTQSIASKCWLFDEAQAYWSYPGRSHQVRHIRAGRTKARPYRLIVRHLAHLTRFHPSVGSRLGAIYHAGYLHFTARTCICGVASLLPQSQFIALARVIFWRNARSARR